VPEGVRPIPRAGDFSSGDRRFLAWLPAAGFFAGDYDRGTAVRVKAPEIKGPRILFVQADD